MQIQVTVPSSVTLTSSKVTCTGVKGFDTTNLTCSGNTTTGIITVSNGFNKTTSLPANITFTVASLKNPSISQTTESFTLKTYNYFGNVQLDQMTAGLTIGFNCTSPCRACSSSASTCTACNGWTSTPYLNSTSNSCQSTCASAYYGSTSLVCTACSSNCLTCSGAAGNCTSCNSGYSLLSTGVCKNTSLFYSQYYFFASGAGAAVALFVILCKLCCCKIKLVPSILALVSILEILSWGGLFYLYFFNTTFMHILILGVALGMHVLLNMIYSLVHQKMIIYQGGLAYKEIMLKYHCWSTLSMGFSFLLTFKFHIIQMSHMFGLEALSGEWSHEIWGVWNMLTVTYIISCYSILAASSAYFVLNNMAMNDHWIWWASIDVAGLSTIIVILMIIETCANCHRDQGVKKDPLKQTYNRLNDTKNASGLVDDMMKKLPPILPLPKPKLTEKTLPSRRGLNETRNGGDDTPLSKRNFTLFPPPSARRKETSALPFDRQEEVDPFPLPQRRGKEEHGRQNVPPLKELPSKQRSTGEAELLKTYIDFLQQEKQLIKEERQEMLRERKKLLDQEWLRQQEFLSLQRQITQSNNVLSNEKFHLDLLRKQFLSEMDRRFDGGGRFDGDSSMMQQPSRYGESSMMRGGMARRGYMSPIPEREPSPVQTRRPNRYEGGRRSEDRESEYTYTYSNDVSYYDKQQQTDMRRSQVRDMQVQVSAEVKPQSSKKRHNQIQTSLDESPRKKQDSFFTRKQSPALSKRSMDQEVQVSEPTRTPTDKQLAISVPHAFSVPPQSRTEQNIQTSRGNTPVSSTRQEKNIQASRGNTPLVRQRTDVNMQADMPEVLEQRELPARESLREVVQLKGDSVNESREYPVSPIKGNMPIASAIEMDGQDNVTQKTEEKPALINKPVYRQDSVQRDIQDNVSEVVAITGNVPVQKLVSNGSPDSGGRLLEKDESMLMQPASNLAYFSQGKSRQDLIAEVDQEQVEPINKGQPYYIELARSAMNESMTDSMVEPVTGNQALYRNATALGGLNSNDSCFNINDSQLEPVAGNAPIYREVTAPVYSEREQAESFMPALTIAYGAKSVTQDTNEAFESQVEPIEGNAAIYHDRGEESNRSDRRAGESQRSQVEPISRAQAVSRLMRGSENESEFYKLDGVSMIEERNESQVEALKGNQPVKAQKLESPERAQERYESQVEAPEQLAAAYEKLSTAQFQQEHQDSLVELIKGNQPTKGNMLEIDEATGLPISKLQELTSSMVEPIPNQPLYQKEDTLQANLNTVNESQIEPFALQAIRGTASQQTLNPAGQERHDSMMEPIRGNQAAFDLQSTGAPRIKQRDEAQLERPPENTPMFQAISNETASKQSTTEAIMQVEPVFERLPPHRDSIVDEENHQTEAPLRGGQQDTDDMLERREQVMGIDDVQAQPLAKKIKRILYSDKSESSIDENMEDTPSNYNIPNGRLDGRSLGLKANLYLERKRGREAKRKPSGTTTGTSNAALLDALQKTMQLNPSETLNLAMVGAQGPNMTIAQNHYFSPPRGATTGAAPVNKLFQDHSEVQIHTLDPREQAILSRGTEKAALQREQLDLELNGSRLARMQAEELDLEAGIMDGTLNNFPSQSRVGGKRRKLNQAPNHKKTFREATSTSPVEMNANPYTIKTTVPIVPKGPVKLKK